jgi:hypothetical protein
MGVLTNEGIGSTGIPPIKIHVFIDQFIPVDFIEIERTGHLNIEFGSQFVDQVPVRGFFIDLIQRV